MAHGSDIPLGARRLGFGVSGPHGTALVRPEATVQMIMHAYALGVRLFDTGPTYGGGEAERRLGEALARLPPYDPIVSTKAGLLGPGGVRQEVGAGQTGAEGEEEPSEAFHGRRVQVSEARWRCDGTASAAVGKVRTSRPSGCGRRASPGMPSCW